MTLELIISLIATGVSIYALYQTRKYSRVSVVPHLDWHVNRHRVNEDITFSFVVKNTGVGPAIILDWWFLLHGKKHDSERSDQVIDLTRICLSGKARYAIKRHGNPGVGSIMPAGQEICIAEIFVPGLKVEQEPLFEQWIRALDFEVRYQSLHGEVFLFSTAQSPAKKNDPPKQLA